MAAAIAAEATGQASSTAGGSGARPRGQRPADRPGREPHHRHRRPDQPARPQRDHRGRAGRGSRQGLRGRRHGSEDARRADVQGDRRDFRPGLRRPGRDRGSRPGHRRHLRHHPPDRRDLLGDRLLGPRSRAAAPTRSLTTSSARAQGTREVSTNISSVSTAANDTGRVSGEIVNAQPTWPAGRVAPHPGRLLHGARTRGLIPSRAGAVRPAPRSKNVPTRRGSVAKNAREFD